MSELQYFYVRAWGLCHGWSELEIRKVTAAARATLAPYDVVYRDEIGQWVRFADTTNELKRAEVKSTYARLLKRWFDARTRVRHGL